jgi:hypothetical protein
MGDLYPGTTQGASVGGRRSLVEAETSGRGQQSPRASRGRDYGRRYGRRYGSRTAEAGTPAGRAASRAGRPLKE